MDVSKDSVSVGILHPEEESPVVERICPYEESVRRLIRRMGPSVGLMVCYEARPTRYERYRLLVSLGVGRPPPR